MYTHLDSVQAIFEIFCHETCHSRPYAPNFSFHEHLESAGFFSVFLAVEKIFRKNIEGECMKTASDRCSVKGVFLVADRTVRFTRSYVN